jgi:hypothetical protein
MLFLEYIPGRFFKMRMSNARAFTSSLTAILRKQPRLLRGIKYILRGHEYAQSWECALGENHSPPQEKNIPEGSENPLLSYFNAHTEGRGIWKWTHYFDIYQRHFSKFVGRQVNVLEIGVYSGGSLKMWKEYFGPHCRIYGVDILEACKEYEDDWTQIFVGDQADRNFWKKVKAEVPALDIIIDDGGHQTEQQIVTLEETLPHLRPGGVYLCEDVSGDYNLFALYIHGMAASLNSQPGKSYDSEKGDVCCSTRFQTSIYSIHVYPFAVIIERNDRDVIQFTAPKRGTEWQPLVYQTTSVGEELKLVYPPIHEE